MKKKLNYYRGKFFPPYVGPVTVEASNILEALQELIAWKESFGDPGLEIVEVKKVPRI